MKILFEVNMSACTWFLWYEWCFFV